MSVSSSVSLGALCMSRDERGDEERSSSVMKRHDFNDGVLLSTIRSGKRSSSSPGGGSRGDGTSWNNGGGGILGEGFQSPPLRRRWFRSLGRVGTADDSRKNPKPTKTRVTLERLRLGLRGCVALAEDELSDVKSSLSDLSLHSNQGRAYAMEKAYSGCGRWLKGLEYALSLVESLAQEYERLVEMREGVRGMAYAYSVSMGPQKEAALSNVKAGFRECTEALCQVETKLQKLLGVFQMEIKGIQGFSRLCCGDVFEISLRHGRQKWKSRGRVGKDGRQTWDIPKASFHGVLDEVMQIKAAELKTLGKEVLLGNKFCDVTELFSAEPQLMTVNLNPTGSLKLNILVTWWPLASRENSPENFGSTLSVSPTPRERCLASRQGSTSEGSNTSTLSSTHSEEETQREAALWERSIRTLTHETSESFNSKENNSDGNGGWSTLRKLDPSGNFSFGRKQGDIVEDYVDGGIEAHGLKDSIRRLAALLEDIQGHFPELEPLHTHTKTLQRLLKNPSFHSSTSSLNVETALECFDFLDEETQEKKIEKKEENFSKNVILESPMSKITDSGIFLPHSESPTLSLGSEEGPVLGDTWDAVLEVHVSACLKLIHKLGSFGPLRFGEKEALRKLQRHSALIGTILSCHSSLEETPGHELLSGCKSSVWPKLGGEKLLISAEAAEERLKAEVRSLLRERTNTLEHMTEKISHSLLTQMLETTHLHPGDRLTRFQVETYFRHTTLKEAVDEIADEEILLEGLRCSFDSGLNSLPSTYVPPKNVLIYLFRSLLDSKEAVRSKSSEFLKKLCSVPSRKRQVEEIAAELLESEEVLDRLVGCASLGLLESRPYAEALIYLAQMDKDEKVRRGAEAALRLLGIDDEIGQDAFRGLGLN